MTSVGQGIEPQVRLFNSLNLVQASQFDAFDPSFLGGVFVGGALA